MFGVFYFGVGFGFGDVYGGGCGLFYLLDDFGYFVVFGFCVGGCVFVY